MQDRAEERGPDDADEHLTKGRALLIGILFVSGLVSLVYQIAWMREFRLIFGMSTAASAAVVAIFMGGLGLGGWFWGVRADRHPHPLALYARLELGITASAAVSPWLLAGVRSLYLALGGSVALGLEFGTILRLILAASVLAVPTMLMGGTLPAAARILETRRDSGRMRVALLYGVNTLGAVSGCLLATFWGLEHLGTRSTLWMACAANLSIAALAVYLGVKTRQPWPPSSTPGDSKTFGSDGSRLRTGLILAAAAIVGFAFFLMELVWYRMLGPLFGGTVFSFGIILATALLGIGAGGLLYALSYSTRRPTLSALAYTCLLEALFIAIPYALGDRISELALLLRSVGALGFAPLVFSWALVAMIVALPVALVAGYQFPLLIGLLGSGSDRVGRHVGAAYLTNTAGAMVGALAGGFGLIPILSAPGCWRFVAMLLVGLGLLTMLADARTARRHWGMRATAAAALACVAAVFVMSTGPTAAWRHSAIGAGRAPNLRSRVDLERWARMVRRAVRWESDGRESSVAVLNQGSGLEFFINGKSDGGAVYDAATQVMSGQLGAMTLPRARRAFVIGLGTGSTAGWLAEIPEMERVDVVELEPDILRVARDFAAVNQNVLSNPKVHIHIGDARELLQLPGERYDLIFSEPSNPYRAGIASLFTQDFYRAVDRRLAEDGVFVQWVQAYEIEASTVLTVLATLTSVFPEVEIWHGHKRDLLLLARRKPNIHDLDRLRKRIGEEPYRSALAAAWRVTTLEGMLSHYVAGSSAVRELARIDLAGIARDDRNLVEFGMAHSVGKRTQMRGYDLVEFDRPALPPAKPTQAPVDWPMVRARRHAEFTGQPMPGLGPELRARIGAVQLYRRGELGRALAAWRSQSHEPSELEEIALLAEGLADAGDPSAAAYIERLSEYSEATALFLSARLAQRQKNLERAARLLRSALLTLRRDPWALTGTIERQIGMAFELANENEVYADRMFSALQQPFSVGIFNHVRQSTLLAISLEADGALDRCAGVLADYEPHVPWTAEFLRTRLRCYSALSHPLREVALRDLRAFSAQNSVSVADLNARRPRNE